MALTANQEIRVRAAIDRAYSAARLPIVWTKPQLDAAIAAADTWQAANKAGFNAALPLAYRNAASTADKALLLIAALAADHLVGNPTQLAVLQNILSELRGIEGA